MELTLSRLKSVRAPSGGRERSELGGPRELTLSRLKSVRAPSGGRERSELGGPWN